MLGLLSGIVVASVAGSALAATDVRVEFALKTTDVGGTSITENRYCYIFRPDSLSKTSPVPVVLLMECIPGGDPATFLHRKANQAGFVVVTCAIPGNSLKSGWNNNDPRISGWEDYDYITEVINRVRASDNCNDVFLCGLSKGGHTCYAYACEKPGMLKAICSLDEFMGLDSNVPRAPLPILAIHGTLDRAVPYTMHKDTVDAWRTVDGAFGATALTTYESSPRFAGRVTQTTWQGSNNLQVAFVTVIGGSHTYPLPGSETGYDFTDGMWAFFAQYLTSLQAAVKIVSQPVNNIQICGQPASFHVAATGGAPLKYEWQKNGATIPGATLNCYTTPPATLADNNSKYCALVSNASGCVTSTVAVFKVLAAPDDPRLTLQSVDQTVMAGQPVRFSVTAKGTGPLSFQWRKNGIEIPGETAPALSLPAAITADCGAVYSVLVSNSAASVVSFGATLTVNPSPGAPILAPMQRVRVLTDQTGTFSVKALSPASMSYQWQKGSPIGNMSNIPGATNAVYTTPPATLSDNHTIVRCVVSNYSGASVSSSEMLLVTLKATAPNKITSSLNVSAPVGAPFRYTISSTGGTAPLTFIASPLPSGLSLNPGTGVISGTPTTVGTHYIIIGASNAAGVLTNRTLVLTVK